jgi:hypothetical protein
MGYDCCCCRCIYWSFAIWAADILDQIRCMPLITQSMKYVHWDQWDIERLTCNLHGHVNIVYNLITGPDTTLDI